MDASNTQDVSANLRLRYNYRPDSDLYVIYNVGTQFASIAPAMSIAQTTHPIHPTTPGTADINTELQMEMGKLGN